MVNVKKRTYIVGFIILALVLIGSIILVWGLMGNYGKQQDKVYSGAKLVYEMPEPIEPTNVHWSTPAFINSLKE